MNSILIPKNIKPLLRFVYYRNERKKFFREIKIRKKQNQAIKRYNPHETNNLIIFLIDGTNWFTGSDNISGGIMSIASIYEESEKLNSIHGAQPIMVTHKNAHLLLKHTQFPNNIPVFRFNQLKLFKNLKQVLIHIPEYLFQPKIIKELQSTLNYIPTKSIHLNILNQRIDIMPSPEIIREVKSQGFRISQTTAHEQYSTAEVREKYDIPLHKLSVYASPERYNFKSIEEKENLILISPDEVDEKPRILNRLKKGLPNFRFKIIRNITYMEYLKLIEKAKYMITFGEGLDFYFIETVFSGGVSLAVYNEEFFTKDFKGLPGIFENYSNMLENIVKEINHLENEKEQYIDANMRQFETCHEIYNKEHYRKNLINFYQKKYRFS